MKLISRPLPQFSSSSFKTVSALTLILASQWAHAEDSRLQTVTVQASKVTASEEAQLKLDEVAGGVSLVKAADVERGRSATLEDTLAYQPGVYAQSAGGNDAIKISIRGSGANTSPGYFREGTKFLFDGLALTGSGGTPYELLETQGLDYTEVLRGANAFQYGALSLGGAINMVTHSGLTAPGNHARLEAGSFGWRKQQLSTGGVVGNGDYYVSLSNSERDGYQDWTFTKAKGVVTNFGYRFNPKLETRLFVRYREEYHESSGTLTKAQLKHNSSRTNPVALASRDDSTKRGSTWVGSKTTYTFDDDATLDFGLVYHNYPQVLYRKSTVNPNYWDWRDLNLSLTYNRSDQIQGHTSNTSLSLTSTQHLQAGVKTYNGNPASSTYGALQKQARYTGSFDRVFAAGNDLQLTDRLWLSTGLSLSQIKRDIEVLYSDRANTSPYPDHYDYDSWNVAPRLGLRYEITPNFQVFGNVSRSIDPPSSWSSSGSGVASNYAKTLTEQKANTVEFGVRGKAGIFDGSLAVYRSWIKDELLTVEVIPATNTSAAVNSTSNASPTIHQGVEAGLDTELWHSARGETVSLRQAYTLNDFYYRNDARFGSNELPGLPKHVYQAELQYRHPDGFYAGVNVRSVSSTAVDYANTLYAPSYTIFGAKLGYEAPSKKWQVYLDVKNLTDQNYVTAIQPIYDAQGKDVAALYPGDGFGAFTGVAFNF